MVLEIKSDLNLLLEEEMKFHKHICTKPVKL